MNRYFVVMLFFVLLLPACSQPATIQPIPTTTPTEAPLDAPPEPTAAPGLIRGDIADYLPAVEDFQEPYLLTGFSAANESIVENWGAEYQIIFEETVRQEGYIGLYDLEPTEMVAPPRLLIVIERFESIEGAADFLNYDFPQGFRNGIYAGESIELGSAENALLATI